MKLTKETLRKLIQQTIKEQLDPVGKTEDGEVPVGTIRDIDNDGDIDDSDSYLALRRKKITQSMNEQMDDESGSLEFHDLQLDPSSGVVYGYVSRDGEAISTHALERVGRQLETLIGIKEVFITDRERLQDATYIEFHVDVVNLVDDILTKAGFTVNS